MTTHFSVSMIDRSGVEHSTTVSIDDGTEVATESGHGLIRLAPAIFKEASERIVAEIAQGKHAPFQPSDLIPVHMSKNGKGERYVVDALYPKNGGPFGDSAEAVDEADAEFQIMWTMVENILSEYDNEMKSMADLEDFLGRMHGITILDTVKEAVRKEAAYKHFARIVEAHEAGDDLDSLMTEGRTMLEALGFLSPLSDDEDDEEEPDSDEPSPRM